MTIWTKSFLFSMLERVIATFLMTFLAVTGLDAGGAVGDAGPTQINWGVALSAAAIAAALSAVKCVIANATTKDGPSALHSEQVVPELPAPAES